MTVRLQGCVILLAMAVGGWVAGGGGLMEAATTAAGASPSTPATTQAQAKTSVVTIDNFAFAPATLTVTAGTAVTWVNHDDVPHTATSSAKPRAFNSGTLDTDEKFTFVFKTAGTYRYFCAVHPHMTGTVIVK